MLRIHHRPLEAVKSRSLVLRCKHKPTTSVKCQEPYNRGFDLPPFDSCCFSASDERPCRCNWRSVVRLGWPMANDRLRRPYRLFPLASSREAPLPKGSEDNYEHHWFAVDEESSDDMSYPAMRRRCRFLRCRHVQLKANSSNHPQIRCSWLLCLCAVVPAGQANVARFEDHLEGLRILACSLPSYPPGTFSRRQISTHPHAVEFQISP